MNCRILMTLLHKEALRHLANRGGSVLIVLLAVASAALAFFGTGNGPIAALSGRAACCYIDYWHDGPWIDHLRRNVPPDLQGRILFRPVERVAAAGEAIYYPAGAGAIQLRSGGDGMAGAGKVWIWHPGTDAATLAVFEAWFWQESARYFRALQTAGPDSTPRGLALLPALAVERSPLGGSADARTAATTALVLFALFLACVYLLPSHACEERERGLGLAVALTPATPLAILTARALFYGTLGIGLAALIVGMNCPAALGQTFFWLAVPVAALGALGVGLTIACLARTQRAASLAALAYTLIMALLIYGCQAAGLPALSCLALEYHVPRMLHAALSGTIEGQHWGNLAAALLLALAWLVLATRLSPRRGWQ